MSIDQEQITRNLIATAEANRKASDDRDPNKALRIFSIALGDAGTESYTRVRVYLLNPGEHFERFGGSKRGYTDRKTATLIVSTLQCGSVRDVAYDLRGGTTHPDVWPWIRRMMLREAGVELPAEE